MLEIKKTDIPVCIEKATFLGFGLNGRLDIQPNPSKKTQQIWIFNPRSVSKIRFRKIFDVRFSITFESN
jgi:hypothetical protein